MATSSLQVQKDNAYDSLVVRRTLVSNKRFVSNTVDTNILSAGLLDVDSIVASSLVVEGPGIINGDLDVSGQVMAQSFALDDANSDGKTWIVQEDPAGTGSYFFQYGGSTQAAITQTGGLVSTSVTSGNLTSTGSITGGLSTLAVNGNSGGFSLFHITGVGVTLTLDNVDNVAGRIIIAQTTTANAFTVASAQNINTVASVVSGAAIGNGFLIVGTGTTWIASAL